MRILFLSHQYPPETGFGGIASYTVTMSRALSERGHEVHVLSCWDGKEPGDTREGDVFVHRRRVPRVPGLARLLDAPGVRQVARPLRVPPDQASASPSLRMKAALACFREYRKLGHALTLVAIVSLGVILGGWVAMTEVTSRTEASQFDTALNAAGESQTVNRP